MEGAIVGLHEQELLEPRPKYREELLRVDKGKFKRFSSISDLRKEIEHK